MSVRDRLVDNRASLFFVIVAMLATLCPAVSAQETASSELPPGWITPTTPGIFQEPTLLKKLASASDNNVGGEPKDGLYAEFGNMITGEGWISAGPGYRRRVLNGAARIDVSAALSWNLYKTVQGSFELPHVAHDWLSIGAQTMYQDALQVEYFGLGNDSRKSDQSAYRFNNLDVPRVCEPPCDYVAIRQRSLRMDPTAGSIHRNWSAREIPEHP